MNVVDIASIRQKSIADPWTNRTPLPGVVAFLMKNVFARRARSEKKLKLIETLSLGGKKQIMVVLYEDQLYFVGSGAESVGSIVPVPKSSQNTASWNESGSPSREIF